jgi:hypothetical protein
MEQVNPLPFLGYPRAGRRLESCAEDALVHVLRGAELGLALGRVLPLLRQQADHGLAAGVRLLKGVLPFDAGTDAGLRVDVKEDVVVQWRILIDQPLLECNRLQRVFARMAQKYAGHRSSPPGVPTRVHTRPLISQMASVGRSRQ